MHLFCKFFCYFFWGGVLFILRIAPRHRLRLHAEVGGGGVGGVENVVQDVVESGAVFP